MWPRAGRRAPPAQRRPTAVFLEKASPRVGLPSGMVRDGTAGRLACHYRPWAFLPPGTGFCIPEPLACGLPVASPERHAVPNRPPPLSHLQVYMNAVWHGWAIPMFLFLAILRLSLNYLIAR